MKKVTEISDKMITNVFISLILASILAYFFHALHLIFNGQYVFWSITRMKYTNIFLKVIPYIKDLIVILLCILLLLKNKSNVKIIKYFLCVIIYGIIMLILSNNFEVSYIASGMRILLYLLSVVMFCKTINCDKKLTDKILKYIKISIFIELFIVLYSIFISSSLTSFGQGGKRFFGTFAVASGLGYYTVACSLFIMIKRFKYHELDRKNYLYMFILIFLALATGSRVSVLSNVIILISYINIGILNNNYISKKKLLIYNIIGAIILLPILYFILIHLVNRGNIMDSGIYRINLLKNIFKIENIKDIFFIFFGRGIGFGTNGGYSLGINGAFFVDNTFLALITQYGILCIVILIYILIKNIKKLKIDIFVIFSVISSLLLLFLAIDVFEQFAFILISVYAFNLLIKDKEVIKNGKTKKY